MPFFTIMSNSMMDNGEQFRLIKKVKKVPIVNWLVLCNPSDLTAIGVPVNRPHGPNTEPPSVTLLGLPAPTSPMGRRAWLR